MAHRRGIASRKKGPRRTWLARVTSNETYGTGVRPPASLKSLRFFPCHSVRTPADDERLRSPPCPGQAGLFFFKACSLAAADFSQFISGPVRSVNYKWEGLIRPAEHFLLAFCLLIKLLESGVTRNTCQPQSFYAILRGRFPRFSPGSFVTISPRGRRYSRVPTSTRFDDGNCCRRRVASRPVPIAADISRGCFD